MKVEFSKVIIVISWLVAITLTLLSAFLVLIDKDISSFSNVVLASWAEVTGANGFYYWKAKNENMFKLGALAQEDPYGSN